MNGTETPELRTIEHGIPEDAEARVPDAAIRRPARLTSRQASALLDRRASITTALVVVAVTGVAWWSTAHSAREMSSMAQGLAQLGTAMPFHMHPLVFLRMWTTMMAAMMLPTIALTVARHQSVNCRRVPKRVAPMVAFGSGYLGVWALTGVVPLAVLNAISHVAPAATWIERTGGAVFILAGLYQFTPWKKRCLRSCRTPSTFLAARDYGSGALGAVRMGLSSGLCCLVSCWALMAAQFVVGVMNLAWMAAIAVVFVAEKNWRHGVGLTTVVGVAVVGLGIAVLAYPHLLNSITFVHHGTMMSE